MKILHVISSPRGEASFSIRLGSQIVQRLLHKYPGSTVKTRNLAEKPFPHLEEVHIQSFHTPPEALTPQLAEAIRHSDEAIGELQEADIIVIGAPMYNFSIHSSLKTWIDHIVRRGVTFTYTESGPEGLVKNKKVYIAVASGGIYSEGFMQSFDFTTPYLTKILGFIGLTDITTYSVEGVALPGIQDQALEKAVEKIAV